MLTKLLTEIPHVTIRLVSHELHQSIHVVHIESILTLSGRLPGLTFAHCSDCGPVRARIITSNLVQSDSTMASHSTQPTISREQAEQLANQNLLGIFNERDTTKRLAQMQATYDKNIAFYDPDKLIKGFDVINDFISQLLDSNPEWTFRPRGNVWVNCDLVMLEWEFGPASQTAPVRGNDVMFVNDEGKVAKMYTMIQGVSDVNHA